ncbi:MAG: MoaD/ThiS family protein, partial [Ectothiorhodospiraceae bacterium]
AAGATVREALAGLARTYPELGQRLFTPEGTVRPYVNIFVGEQGVGALGGLDAPLAGGEVIAIIPAVAGGSFDLRA